MVLYGLLCHDAYFLWGHKRLGGRLCRAIQDHTGPYGTMQDHMEPYGTHWTIRDPKGPYQNIPDHTVLYRTLQDDLELC